MHLSRGCFASGYPYFLCGLTKPSVYEILMRAELNQRNCYLLFEDSPRRSSSIKFRITISRSYSGDCQGPENHLSDLAVLPGPRSGVPPVPAVPICYLRNPLNSPIPAAYPMSIADWLISRAKLDESKEQCSIATGTEVICTIMRDHFYKSLNIPPLFYLLESIVMFFFLVYYFTKYSATQRVVLWNRRYQNNPQKLFYCEVSKFFSTMRSFREFDFSLKVGTFFDISWGHYIISIHRRLFLFFSVNT